VYFNSIGIPGRNYGIFTHPNTLGGIASTSLLFMIGFKWKKIYMLLPIFCLIKSGSRTAILVSLLVLIIYSIRLIFLSQKISNSLRKIEYPLVVGTFLMGILLAATVQFLNYIDLIDPSALTARAQIWQRSLEIFKASSLFGLGFNWEDRAIESQLLNLWATSAHNVLLEILFATGIVGLVVVLFCIVKVLAFFPNLDLIEKLAVVAMLTIGISESFISVQYPSFLTYLFFAIAVGANREMKERL
jgi:O-antigen ligase